MPPLTPTLCPPEGLGPIIARLEAAGFPTWCVGGAVRDAWLGVPAGDWDLATQATPAEMKALFPQHHIPTGEAHGTITLGNGQGLWVEATTFRRDVSTDGRNATVTFASSIEEDLERRDFTCNAMAVRLATGEWRDPFDGRADMARGCLRTVGDPDRRFAEDRLRVLRTFRLAGRFGWTIVPETWAAAVAATPALGQLSAERIKQEIDKTFASDRPSRALQWWDAAGAWSLWAPELHAIDPAVRAAMWPRVDATWGSLAAGTALSVRERLALALSLAGPAGAEAILYRWKASHEERRQITSWVAHRQADATLLTQMVSAPSAGWPQRALREAAARWGRAAVPSMVRMHARALDVPAQGVADTLASVQNVLRAVPLHIKDLTIGGDDLLQDGHRRGPAIGDTLAHLLAWVLEDPSRHTPDQLRAEATRHAGRRPVTSPPAPQPAPAAVRRRS